MHYSLLDYSTILCESPAFW